MVALFAFGPDELPQVIRAAAKFVKAFRKTMRQFTGAFENLMEEDDLKRTEKELKKPTTIIGDDGNAYQAYDITDIEDVSRKKEVK